MKEVLYKLKIIIFLLGFSVICLLSYSEDKESSDKNKKLLNLNAYARTTFKYERRWIGETIDEDYYQYLSGSFHTDNYSVSGEFFGRVSWDMDDFKNAKGYYQFDSVTDSFAYNANGRLYYGYVRIGDPGFFNIDDIKLGRQYAYEGETLHFDGIRFDTKAFGLLGLNPSFSFYGGVPASLYESSQEGDKLKGFGIQLDPYLSTRIRIDSQSVWDSTVLYGDKHTLFNRYSIWQKMSPYLSLYGHLSYIENKKKDDLLRATLTLPEAGFLIQAAYTEQFEILKDYAVEFDPFYAYAGDYFPYQQYNFDCSKEISDNFVIGGGFASRDLTNNRIPDAFNREFLRWYVTPTISNFPIKNTELSFTREIYDTADNNVRTYDAVISQKFMKKLKVSAGTYYSIFKYDYLSNAVEDDVRTYFFKFEYVMKDGIKATFNYETEKEKDLDETERKIMVDLGYSF